MPMPGNQSNEIYKWLDKHLMTNELHFKTLSLHTPLWVNLLLLKQIQGFPRHEAVNLGKILWQPQENYLPATDPRAPMIDISLRS
jgi:hypothetical protein